MKIRFGFVSNSSTTSFCIFGIFFENKEEVFERLRPEIKEKFKDYDDVCPCSLFDNIKGISYESGCNRERYFGARYSSMNLDETRGQFEERIRTLLSEVFTDVNAKELSEYEDAFYDS